MPLSSVPQPKGLYYGHFLFRIGTSVFQVKTSWHLHWFIHMHVMYVQTVRNSYTNVECVEEHK